MGMTVTLSLSLPGADARPAQECMLDMQGLALPLRTPFDFLVRKQPGLGRSG